MSCIPEHFLTMMMNRFWIQTQFPADSKYLVTSGFKRTKVVTAKTLSTKLQNHISLIITVYGHAHLHILTRTPLQLDWKNPAIESLTYRWMDEWVPTSPAILSEPYLLHLWHWCEWFAMIKGKEKKKWNVSPAARRPVKTKWCNSKGTSLMTVRIIEGSTA